MSVMLLCKQRPAYVWRSEASRAAICHRLATTVILSMPAGAVIPMPSTHATAAAATAGLSKLAAAVA